MSYLSTLDLDYLAELGIREPHYAKVLSIVEMSQKIFGLYCYKYYGRREY